MIGTQPSILIAEDERALSNALELKLKNAGFLVTVAKDGVEVMKLTEEKHFDLLLLDLIMPNKDGFAVLTELVTNKSKLPVVILSNLGQSEDERRAKELGAVDYWVKADISLNEVEDKIMKLLDVST